MNGENKSTPYAGIVGDLVASREHPDRRGLQRRLAVALKKTNGRVQGVQALRSTIGDEFQGLYEELPAALQATLLVRLHMHSISDVRFGVGWGSLRFTDPSKVPFGQDGPAWWAARDAIGLVAEAMGHRERPAGWRTSFLVHPSARMDRNFERAVRAFLVCRDELVGRMDARDVRLLLAALERRPQEAVARSEGISQSAVSQRNHRNGVYAIVQATEALGMGKA